MSKRNIAYVKPQDPKFLQILKQQIGYKEGPSVETKRQKLEDLGASFEKEDSPEREDEKPQIVVLNSGDLTSEQVAAEEKRLAKEIAETPADLSQPIVFRKRHKVTDDITSEKKPSKDGKNKNKGVKPTIKTKVKLSFNVEEEEDQ